MKKAIEMLGLWPVVKYTLACKLSIKETEMQRGKKEKIKRKTFAPLCCVRLNI